MCHTNLFPLEELHFRVLHVNAVSHDGLQVWAYEYSMEEILAIAALSYKLAHIVKFQIY